MSHAMPVRCAFVFYLAVCVHRGVLCLVVLLGVPLLVLLFTTLFISISVLLFTTLFTFLETQPYPTPPRFIPPWTTVAFFHTQRLHEYWALSHPLSPVSLLSSSLF